MKSKILLSSCLLPLGGLLHPAFAQEKKANEADRPNIIMFLVDDMGWQDTSLPFWTQRTKYNDTYHTPNMERLAKQGEMFTQAYACSISSPSRVSLFSGMNAARHRVTSWTLEKNKSHEQPDSIMEYPQWNVNGICQEPGIERTTQVTSLAQVLKDNGYYTIHCGKAHFGAIDTPGADPKNMGFDVNIAGHAGGAPASYLPEKRYGNTVDHKNQSLFAVPGLEKYYNTDTFLTEALTLEAMKAMDTAQTKKEPFFLYMAHYAVHTPIQPDKRFYQKYLDKGLPEVEAAYASLVEGMDKSLGDIMDYLKKNHLEKNTIILFMSDNGGLAAHTRAGKLHTQNYPLNSGKGSAYEGGVREPMIVKWPGVVKPDTKCDHYVMIEDFYPTILEMAQIKKYKTVQKTDGISFLPLLTGKGKMPKRAIYWHYPNSWGPHGPGIGATSAIRSGDWKLVYYYADGKHELFNIPNDIGEHHDLSGQYPQIVRILSLRLSNYLRSVDAQRPILKRTGKVAPWPDETGLGAQVKNQRTPVGVNLSLWGKKSTQPHSDRGSTILNVGISSKMHNLYGVGANLIASTVKQEMYGVQVSGVCNIVGDKLKGVSISGFGNVFGGNAKGVIVSGITNIGQEVEGGILLSGLTNICENSSNALVLSGMANIVNRQNGLAVSGLLNIAGESGAGMMASGLMNIAAGDFTGIQITGGMNLAGKESKGVQIALANVASSMKGVQIGLVNCYMKDFKGAQIGLVNLNPRTQIQYMLSAGNQTKLNFGARFKNNHQYTLLSAGIYPLKFKDKFSASATYRLGLLFPIGKKVEVGGDMGYQHIETFKNKHHGIPARMYGLEPRLTAEYKISRQKAVFIAGGYHWSRPYNEDRNYDKGAAVEVGMFF